MNTLNWFLAPLFIHFAMTSFVGLRTNRLRVASVRKGETKLKDIALNSAAWPQHVRQWGNNFDNQFDLPTVWYALTALIVATAKIDLAFIILAWVFVASRLVHTYIHTSTNTVIYRMFAYLGGFGAITLMWVWFGIRLFFVG